MESMRRKAVPLLEDGIVDPHSRSRRLRVRGFFCLMMNLMEKRKHLYSANP